MKTRRTIACLDCGAPTQCGYYSPPDDSGEQDALRARVEELEKALRGVLTVAPTSADMRLLIRVVGGVSKTAEAAIAQFDKLDGAVDVARAALSAPDTKELKALESRPQ